MPTLLSRYIPADSPALREEFEIAYVDEIEALYTRFCTKKAIKRLEAEKPGILNTPIEQLRLPSRTVSSLKGKGFDTVSDLIALTEEDLAKVPGLSRETAHIALSAVDSLITSD